MISHTKLLQLIAADLRDDKPFVVGGAVRDRLLGRATTDIDLIVPKDAKSVAARLAKKQGGRDFVLDEERRVYRITIPENTDHAALQLDIADWQGKSLEEDLSRRDFTVNALAIDLSFWGTGQWKRKIVNLHGGISDLKKKRINVISPRVFKEDPLRLLRAFRMSAELGFSIAPQTSALIRTQAALLKKPSPERVREEILKMLKVSDSYRVVAAMDKLGILEILMPEAKQLRATAEDYYGKGGVLKHTLESLFQLEQIFSNLKSWFPRVHRKVHEYIHAEVSGFTRLAHLKWAVLLHDVGKPKTAKIIDGRMRFFEHEHVGARMVSQMGNRYRWSNEETERHARLVNHHMRVGNLANHPDAKERAFYRFFKELGDDAVGMLLVSLGDHLSYLTKAQLRKRNSPHELTTIKMMNMFYLQKEKVLPKRVVTGHDIMTTLQLPPSPLIGTLLNDVAEAQAEGKIHTKEEALAFLKEQVAQHAIKK